MASTSPVLTSVITTEPLQGSNASWEVEKDRRVRAMVAKMDELGFGNCTNTGACSAECPKNIKLYNIGRMNRQFIAAKCKE